MSSHLEIIFTIRALLILQSRLMTAFREAHPDVQDWPMLLDCPRSGVIVSDGERWAFQKHGSGLTFRNESDVVVDMHRGLPDADIFDAWRLLQYLESVRAQAHVPPTESALTVTLDELSRGGYLRTTDVPGAFRLSA